MFACVCDCESVGVRVFEVTFVYKNGRGCVYISECVSDNLALALISKVLFIISN